MTTGCADNVLVLRTHCISRSYTFILSTIIQTKSSATVPTKDWYKLWENMVTVLLATGGGAEGWRWRWPVVAVATAAAASSAAVSSA